MSTFTTDLRKLFAMTQLGQETLGAVLRLARESKIYTLRFVEEKTGISNAYLSQLETDKIKKPGADTLYKLSEVYNIDFNFLLQKAGLVEKNNDSNLSVGRFIFSKANLTGEEEEELISYLQHIRKRQKK